MIDGVATFAGRSKRRHLHDGTMVGIIATERFNKQCLNLFYDQLYTQCPITPVGSHSLIKNAQHALISYLYFLINNQMAQGYSPFHHTTLKSHKPSICHNNNKKEHKLGLNNGDKFVWYTKILPVTFTGDGGPVKNVTHWIHNLVILMLQILGLGTCISQSIYCGACVMISSLSESDTALTPIIQNVGSTLASDGSVAIKAEKENTFICFRYKRFNIADWKFTFTHLNLSVGVTGDYALIEICIWANGIPYGIHKDEFYDCLMMKYIDPWTVPSFDECKQQHFNGLVLTDKYVLQHWGQETENLLEIEKKIDESKGLLHKWDNDEYVHKKRKDVAQTKAYHGILHKMIVPLDPALVDMAHAFWSFMGLFESETFV